MINKKEIVSIGDLADLFGVSVRHLRDLVSEGRIKKTERGQYLLYESIQGYISYLIDKNNASVDLKEEKIRNEIEKLKKDTELKELKILERRNQLHSADIVKEVMEKMLTNLKGKMLSISNKLAPQIIAMDNLGEIQDCIQDEVIEALKELSEYNSDMFVNKNFVEIEEEEEIENEEKPKKRGRPKKSRKSI